MKAVKIQKVGGPEVLELEEITLSKPGNDEVLIEHIAIGLNYIDTYHRSGLYPLAICSINTSSLLGLPKVISSSFNT